MIYVLSGVVEFDTSGTRVLDVPALSSFPATGESVPFLSSVEPDDPADLGLFRLAAVAGIAGSADPLVSYLGGRQVTVTYALTGGSPIDVRFYLVWDSEVSYSEKAYNGS